MVCGARPARSVPINYLTFRTTHQSSELVNCEKECQEVTYAIQGESNYLQTYPLTGLHANGDRRVLGAELSHLGLERGDPGLLGRHGRRHLEDCHLPRVTNDGGRRRREQVSDGHRPVKG